MIWVSSANCATPSSSCMRADREKALVDELFADPKHPYSEGLLHAIPRITKERKPLLTIEGAVPNPTERIEGCTFWPRCPHASEICKRAEAPQKQLTGERSVKCWLYAEEADRETAEKRRQIYDSRCAGSAGQSRPCQSVF